MKPTIRGIFLAILLGIAALSGPLHAEQNSGAVPVDFGPCVLRVETAALYALSVLAYETVSAV